MYSKQFAAATIFILCPLNSLMAQRMEPQLISLFPLGGKLGSSFEVRIRGQNLEGAYAAWFDCEAIKAEVKIVEEVDLDQTEEPQAKKAPGRKGHQVVLKVRITPAAELGDHKLRIVSRRGVSDAVPFRVHAEAVIAESESPHQRPGDAQFVSFPAVINGRIGNKGELDYYAIDVPEGQELRFEVFTTYGLLAPALAGDRIEQHPRDFREPELFLYELSGSWFDPHRITRLKFRDESSFFYYPESIPRLFHYFPRLTHRFTKRGRYLVEVGVVDGQGGPDYAYQLRIVQPIAEKRWPPSVLAPPGSIAWPERDFARRIDADWLRALWSRTVKGSEGTPALTSTQEKEPKDKSGQALEINEPGIVEGTIVRPGDVDYFKFRAKSGQRLVFEIETPDVLPPAFSPRLGVSDVAGRELFTNVFRKIDGDGDDWVKSIEPKTIFTFVNDGEYYLQMRDLTSQRGASGFAYRVLIRHQIPHLGEVVAKSFTRQGYGFGTECTEDRINLVPGGMRKLSIITDKEEGFQGEVAIAVEGLPRGVQAFPAVGIESDEFPFPKGAQGQSPETYAKLGTENNERFRPPRVITTIMLLARADAPVTAMPRFIRLTVRPVVVEGRQSEPFPFQELPLMVVSIDKQ
jgi:hypothetical protein